MDELDDIARRSSETVRAQAARIAYTEDALRDLQAGTPAPTKVVTRPNRWMTVGLVAAVAAALVVGAVVLLNRDERRSIVTSVPSVVDTQSPATEPTTPATETPATTAVPTTTTTSVVDAPEHRLDPLVDHGLSSSISAEFLGVRRQDYLAPDATDRADYRLTIYPQSGAKLVVNLGHDSNQYPNRQPVTIGDDEGWESAGDQYSDVAYVVSRQLDDTTWLRVEAMRADGDTPLVVPSAADMRALAAAFEYDPTLDDRVSIVTAEPTYVQPQACTNDVSVTGGGPDMVLFLCDGRLGVFSGETGEMIELIQQFEDQRGDGPSEGPGVSYVDGIDVSSDGTTIYFSVGPEPAVGTTYRYVRGSGIEPEMIGYGHSPAVAPGSGDQFVATIALDDILIIDPHTPEQNRSLTGFSINPQSTPSWSLDGSQIAFGVGRGVVAVAQFTGEHDGETHLYASDEPGRWFANPWYTEAGLLADSYCCDDQSGSAEIVALEQPGNHPAPAVSEIRPLDQTPPIDGTVGPADAPWATGVITWAPID